MTSACRSTGCSANRRLHQRLQAAEPWRVAGTNLDEAERQEGHVVRTEQRVEQHLFDSPVEVALQLLHLGPNQLWRVSVRVGWTRVRGHVGGAGELLSEILP